MWFPEHLKGPVIPDPSGQLAELIVYISSTRVDLYSHQILLWPDFIIIRTNIRTELIFARFKSWGYCEICPLCWKDIVL